MFKGSNEQFCSKASDLEELNQELLDKGCLPNTFNEVDKDLIKLNKNCTKVIKCFSNER